MTFFTEKLKFVQMDQSRDELYGYGLFQQNVIQCR